LNGKHKFTQHTNPNDFLIGAFPWVTA
jgi:hypothetical protein